MNSSLEIIYCNFSLSSFVPDLIQSNQSRDFIYNSSIPNISVSIVAASNIFVNNISVPQTYKFTIVIYHVS